MSRRALRSIAANVICAAVAIVTAAAPAGRSVQKEPVRPVTFSEDIAPIIFDRCGGCHRPGGDAPFSLLTYEAARQRAVQMAEVTRTRFMPPWKAEPGYGEFVGQRHLTASEIALFQRWIDDKTSEGDPRRLPTRQWPEGWQLGQPDIVVTLSPPFPLQPGGSDVSRVFVIPIPVTATKFVRGLDFRPGNPRVVHHANIRIDRTRASRQLDEQDPAPGYDGLILRSAVFPDGHFLGWTPGQIAPLLPKGLAWRLDAGTDLVVQVHMQPDGKPEIVQPSIGIYFSNDPPERTPAMLRLGRQNIDIAAGEQRYTVTDSFVLPTDVEVQAVQPHAHYLAREIRGTAALPDGTTRSLIYIRDWDFRWQHVYRYVTPLSLPRGTTLSMQYTYDNSSANARNPQRPPQRVSWGQWSNDEMGDLWIQVLTRTADDLRTLNAAFRPKMISEDAVGYEAMIRKDPSKSALRDDAALLYLELGRPGDAVRHFEASARLQPRSAAAHYNFATVLALTGDVGQAIEQLNQALTIRPDYALAHNNLGDMLLKVGKADAAIEHFREAIRLDPLYADAHYNLGSVWRTSGRIVDAIAEFRLALEAYAAAGQFDRAVAVSDEAIALNPPESLATQIRERRARYLRGVP